MNDIGLQDLPPDAIETLRRVPKLLAAAHFSGGKDGRTYVRVDRAAVERHELMVLAACPLLARIMAGSSLILIFDPDLASAEERERKRQAMIAQLEEVAPEVAADISRGI